MKRIFTFCFLLLFCILATLACRLQQEQQQIPSSSLPIPGDSLAIRKAFASSPVVSPKNSLKMMQVQPGFAVKLVASEPLVNAPVALTFDEKGRIWAVEMQGYMPNIQGEGEEARSGKIVILEDTNKDGVMDTREVFLDSLVLPRALCLVENGILVAEPPNLWFFEIQHDRAGKKTLVDDAYSGGENVEHEPNGLVRALDNWIYNAKSAKRYRKKGEQWLIEKTHFRGQWGITQDDYGRLYYNNNSQNLLGDYFLPGVGAGNPNQPRVAGFNEAMVPDNRVYPARPTPGVNRGYQQGVLDGQLRLVNFTAACAPLIYRGNLLGDSYGFNAFVAEPAGNLIKRNVLQQEGRFVSGKQAYSGHEFLASTDERFRPVSLYDGPDGALYIVDMYRGVIQHEYFLTDYLKNEIKSRQLEQPLSFGRIYKVVPEKAKLNTVTLPDNPQELVKLLEHENGWVRDKAQQHLVDNRYTAAAPALRQALKNTEKPVTVVHALWTLEGMGALQAADVTPLLHSTNSHLRQHALYALPLVVEQHNYAAFLPVAEQMLQHQDTLAAPYVVYLAHALRQYNQAASERLLYLAVKQFPDDNYVADAVISGLQDREEPFYKNLLIADADKAPAVAERLGKVLQNIEMAKRSKDPDYLAKELPRGAALYRSACQPCHAADGNGVASLAPPLNNSEWVLGDKKKLLPIILYGLTGPIEVAGKLYQAPEISMDMPGIGENKDIKDEDVAQLVNFIRNSWSNVAVRVSEQDVNETRRKFKGRQKPFTAQELLKLEAVD